MDKKEFDLDYEFDFEKEYGFDPKEFMSSDDDFTISDFLNGDIDLSQAAGEGDYTYEAPEEEAYEADEEDLSADFPGRTDDRAGAAEYAEYSEEEYPEGEYDDAAYAEPGEEQDEYSEETAEFEDVPVDYSNEAYYEEGFEEEPEQKKGKFPKLPGRKKQKQPKNPDKKSTFGKLMDIYLEPLSKAAEAEKNVLDPTDPKYLARKRRERKRIFKEVYLPAIIAGVAFFLVLSFLVGSISNAVTMKKKNDNDAQEQAQQQASAAGAAEVEFKRLVAEAESLAVGYDYDAAIALLESYRGTNDKFMQQINAKKAELINEKSQLSEWKDVSGIPNLSFHVLMADASRACNKDVSGADLAGLYNKNFVSVEEFSRILNQLYSSNYVLVDFNSFISSNTGVDGNQSFFTQSLYLPSGKKPIMLTETMVNYFEYMVDPDKDGTPDAKGHGFANKLVVDGNGEIKAAYVDANGQSLIGNYDFVPVLEAFIQEHPDFSYRGARAILAVTGTEGVFGYRTNTAYVSRFGQSFYDTEVADAKKVVEALRNKGYTIASYTYSNQAYRSMTTLQIQAEINNWSAQITPVVGEIDTIVFARGSDIEAYSGTTFNVLYNSGLRFFLNSGSSPRVDANTTFIRQTRLMVTGESMAWYTSQFSQYFDCNVVLDTNARGSIPVKS